jgi:hypothetical protein
MCGHNLNFVFVSWFEYSQRSQLPWLDVKKEMTEEKGLDPAAADKIENM